ncbi:MAG TPA: hypothetical protein VIV11_18985, partial [Kofleriaceae bacterium]
YSFGCIAFELLTGQPPFRGRMMEVLDAHMNRPAPRPSEVRPEAKLSAALDAIVLRCLEKEPERRFQRGRDIAGALVATTTRSPASERGRRGNAAPAHPDEATDVGWRAQGSLDGKPATDPIAADPIRWEYETLLGVLAAALLDTGCNDIHLVLAHAEFSAIWQSIAAHNDDLTELARRSEKIEQRAREQDSRLRFMLGELRFERDNSGGDAAVSGDLMRRIEALETQLASSLRRRDKEIASLADREVLLIAEVIEREDALADARRALAVAVASQIAPFVATDPIATLHKRMLELRALLGLDA